jgi:hypothetical protein
MLEISCVIITLACIGLAGYTIDSCTKFIQVIYLKQYNPYGYATNKLHSSSASNILDRPIGVGVFDVLPDGREGNTRSKSVDGTTFTKEDLMKMTKDERMRAKKDNKKLFNEIVGGMTSDEKKTVFED